MNIFLIPTFYLKFIFTYLSNSVVRVEAVPAVMWWELGYTLHSANLKQNPNQKRHSLEAVLIVRYKGLEDCWKYITGRLVMTHMSHDLDQDAFMRSGWHQCRRKGHRRDHENFQAARKLDERVRRTKNLAVTCPDFVMNKGSVCWNLWRWG